MKNEKENAVKMQSWEKWGQEKRIPSHLVKGLVSFTKSEISDDISEILFDKALKEFSGRRVI